MVIPCIDMKIILIGAGNLATQLAVALQKKGMTPAYIYSRTRESAEQLSERLRDVPYSTDISQVPTDGYLRRERLRSARFGFPHALQSRPLGTHGGKHGHGSVRPVYRTVRCILPHADIQQRTGNRLRRYSYFCRNEPYGRYRTFAKIGRSVIDKGLRSDLRTAQVPAFGCRVRLQLLQSPLRLVRPHSVGTRAAVRDHAAAHTGQAQTGPAIRYDKNVIDKQMALLSDPTMRQIYDLMSRSIHETNKH